MRRHTQVGEDSVDSFSVALMKNMVVDPAEIATDQCETRIVNTVAYGIHIAVECEHTAIV